MALNKPVLVAFGLALVLAGAGVWSLQLVTSHGSTETSLPPPDATVCGQLLIGLAGGVLADDDKVVRRYVHPELLARLPKDRPLSAQLREVLPDAPVLLRFGDARFTAEPPVTLPPVNLSTATEPTGGRVRVAVHAELGGGARFEGTLMLGADDGRWKLLGMAQ